MGVRLLLNTSLYTLKYFLVISTIYSTAFAFQESFLKNWDKIQALA